MYKIMDKESRVEYMLRQGGGRKGRGGVNKAYGICLLISLNIKCMLNINGDYFETLLNILFSNVIKINRVKFYYSRRVKIQ